MKAVAEQNPRDHWLAQDAARGPTSKVLRRQRELACSLLDCQDGRGAGSELLC